mgnify:CR=1 FL=1
MQGLLDENRSKSYRWRAGQTNEALLSGLLHCSCGHWRICSSSWMFSWMLLFRSERSLMPSRMLCSPVRIANEVLMFFRSQKKIQGEVSLSETLETDKDGNNLFLMDIRKGAQHIPQEVKGLGLQVLLLSLRR